MKIILLNTFYFVVCTGFLSACSDVDSTDIKTSGMHAVFSVTALGDGNSEVKGKLTVGSGGNGTVVELTNGESLVATVSGQTKTLIKNDHLIGGVDYSVIFNVDTTTENFVVALNRVDDTDAPNSEVTLPVAFTIDAPASNDAFIVTDTITTVWTPVGISGDMSIQYRLVCTAAEGGSLIINRLFTALDSAGTHTEAIATLFNGVTDIDKTKSCNTTIELQREQKGNLDPNFGEGGTITGIQKRTISVVISP